MASPYNRTTDNFEIKSLVLGTSNFTKLDCKNFERIHIGLEVAFRTGRRFQMSLSFI